MALAYEASRITNLVVDSRSINLFAFYWLSVGSFHMNANVIEFSVSPPPPPHATLCILTRVSVPGPKFPRYLSYIDGAVFGFLKKNQRACTSCPIPIERRGSPFKTHLPICFRVWFVQNLVLVQERWNTS